MSKKRTNIYIDRELLARCQERADRAERSLNWELTRMIAAQDQVEILRDHSEALPRTAQNLNDTFNAKVNEPNL